ncbi:hypothetical protein KSP40_PGU001740 [Platanthera guangdongensis]|uniref:Uncharacterized protein n=1 Tax=Platanthera guangdongensis TaxID=2320717 RepID=A0ABR2MGW5_9ASPA
MMDRVELGKHTRDIIIKAAVSATLAAAAVAMQYIPSEDEELSEDELDEDDDIVSPIQATDELTNFRENLAIDMLDDPFAGESSRPRKKRAVRFDAYALADAIKAVAASIQALKSGTADNGQPSATHSERIYAELARLPDLEEQEILKAMDILGCNDTKYKIFMALPDRLRTVWLRMHIYD